MTFTILFIRRSRLEYDRLNVAASEGEKNRKAKGERKRSKVEGLFRQVVKTLNLLSSNPKHPGLHTHEYDAIEHPYDKKEKVWEAYVQNRTPSAYRIFWCYGPNRGEISILAITPHP